MVPPLPVRVVYTDQPDLLPEKLEDLPVKMLSKEDKEQFVIKNEFSSVIHGKKFTYQLPTGGSGKRAAKLSSSNRDTPLTFSLLMRIQQIEGIQRNDIRKYIDDTDLADLMLLIDEFDKHDCGVDGDLEIECPDCGGIQDKALPFEGEFFFPKTRKSRNMSSVETQP